MTHKDKQILYTLAGYDAPLTPLGIFSSWGNSTSLAAYKLWCHIYLEMVKTHLINSWSSWGRTRSHPLCVKNQVNRSDSFWITNADRQIDPNVLPSQSEGNYRQQSHLERMSHYKYTPSEIAAELKSSSIWQQSTPTDIWLTHFTLVWLIKLQQIKYQRWCL